MDNNDAHPVTTPPTQLKRSSIAALRVIGGMFIIATLVFGKMSSDHELATSLVIATIICGLTGMSLLAGADKKQYGPVPPGSLTLRHGYLIFQQIYSMGEKVFTTIRRSFSGRRE